ncbi:RNA-binding S4 domain-containing protein [Halothiobacillus sp.]|jgi:ribosome-associated heat shock protein Hsp15|uniref:RNA-binding S4 domain-containing protein n=2 Tax=Halothiobacillus sp. TaxID=1891311 RepID=UPI00261B0475|nr:RNA-binding S4 domain-containing protein [Halothiobacillus sp.]MDD4966549.1 RNA-binding S4 domain-containing protein [Halothiobacillus sp.]MDY0147125.1 RNA-binding S4 domain-containing protein [Halothiobacillus sp.]
MANSSVNSSTNKTQQTELKEQRIDTWLWAARFFKTRSLASTAIEGGKIEINGQSCKKSGKVIRIGDELSIERGETKWVVTVSGLSKQRGSATVAQTLYSESPEHLAERLKIAEQNRQNHLMNPSRVKPDQHTRILLRALRGKPS